MIYSRKYTNQFEKKLAGEFPIAQLVPKEKKPSPTIPLLNYCDYHSYHYHSCHYYHNCYYFNLLIIIVITVINNITITIMIIKPIIMVIVAVILLYIKVIMIRSLFLAIAH